MIKGNNTQSTFDRLMADPEFKKQYDEDYAEFDAQEQLLALMEESNVSVRVLAAQSGVSPTTVQKFRKGAFGKLKVESLQKIAKALGKDLKVSLI